MHAYAERLGIEWKANGLRHSFISYLVAKTKDIASVSYEAGNSPSIIKLHYLELCTQTDGERWFEISPEHPANVIGMEGAV